MDLGFIRRNAARLEALDVRPDYAQLTATLAAAQASTPTARRAALDAAVRTKEDRPVHALVTLLVPGKGWTRAIATLDGSFSPGVADPASPGKAT